MAKNPAILVLTRRQVRYAYEIRLALKIAFQFLLSYSQIKSKKYFSEKCLLWLSRPFRMLIRIHVSVWCVGLYAVGQPETVLASFNPTTSLHRLEDSCGDASGGGAHPGG